MQGRRRQIGQLAALAERRPRAPSRSAGTGFVVCAVCGLTPSGSSICSALPWSAVIEADAAELGDALDDAAEAARRSSRTAATTAGIDAGVADHVGVREVDDAERVAVPDLGARRGRRPRRPTSPACGRSSARRAGSGRGSRVSPGPGVLAAAVEEVRDVRVLLGLGDVQLPQRRAAASTSAIVFGDVLLGERRPGVSRSSRSASSSSRRSRASSSSRVSCRAAVGPEVEEDRRVSPGSMPRRALDARSAR